MLLQKCLSPLTPAWLATPFGRQVGSTDKMKRLTIVNLASAYSFNRPLA